jgi:pimeloyl-ACP methyl ester carboxylesterase
MQLTVDGHTVNATTGGRPLDPDAPLVVFIHGAGLDRTIWVLQTRYFAAHGWSVLAVDLPGHAGSDGPALGSIEAMAQWTERLLEAAGFERAAVVGHSMGSYVGLHLAAAQPSRVTKLALLGTAAAMPVHPDLLRLAQAGDRAANELLISWSLTSSDRVGGHPTPGMWMTGNEVRLMNRIAPGVLGVELEACRTYESAVEMAARVRCPTLLLIGQRDVMTRPSAATPLADALSDATTFVIPDAGHLMMVDHPDETLDHLISFLGPAA